MQYIVYYVIPFLLPIRSSCNLYLQQDERKVEINRDAIKCLDAVIAITDWAVDDFAVIFDDIDTIEFDSFEKRENYTWKMLNSNVSSGNLSGFVNVILFAISFESLKETASRINIRPMDTRSKYVITVMQDFSDLGDIRKASTGIGPAMWKLDKTRVVYLVPRGEDILIMTYFPLVRNCGPGELEVLDVWRKGEFRKRTTLFPEKVLDFRGCVQNHTGRFSNRTALQGHKVITETGELTLGGVGGKVTAIIAEKLNMQLRLVPDQHKNLQSIIDMIATDKALFWAFANVPIAEQLPVLDIGSGYMEESFGFGYRTKGYEISWRNLVWPLSKQVWLYTGFTLVLFCGLVLVTNCVYRRKFINFDEVRILDIFGVFFGVSRPLPRNISGRYLFGIWVFYSYLIIASYNCGLVSFLTTPNEKSVINTLAELLEDGMDFGGSEVQREFYNDPSDPVMMKIYDKYKLWSLEEAASFITKKKIAAGYFGSSVHFYNRNRTDVNNHVRMLKEKAFTYLVPISMRRGSPFTIGVRRYASRIIQGGLNEYWYRHYVDKVRFAEKNEATPTPTPISMMHVRGIFCLHVSALMFSCLIFIGELLFNKYSPVVSSSLSTSS